MKKWTVHRRSEHMPPPLFCPRCDVMMSTEDDVRSRDARGVCATCVSDGKVGVRRDPALDAMTIAISAEPSYSKEK